MGLALRVGAVPGVRLAGRRLQFPIDRGSTRRELARPLVFNGEFAPPTHAAAAHEPFVGILSLAETRMKTLPAEFKSATILGRDPQLFPAVKLAFFTAGDDLVPVTQEVILAGSAGQGRSYWDLIVQPGAVWSLPDDRGGRGRASIRIGQCARGRNPQRSRHICLQARQDDARAPADRATDGPLLRLSTISRELRKLKLNGRLGRPRASSARGCAIKRHCGIA